MMIISRTKQGFSRIRSKFQKISLPIFFSTKSSYIQNELLTQEFVIDEKFFRTERNQKEILKNIKAREMCDDFPSLFQNGITTDELSCRLIDVARSLPNDFHPIWNEREFQLNIVEHVGSMKQYDFKPLRAEEILHSFNLAHFSSPTNGKLGVVAGSRSYMFLGPLSKLARALEQWTMNRLVNDYGFTPVVTPTMIYSDLIRACGFEPFGERTQVYSFENRENVCLAGTAEMPLASLNLGENFATEEELPKRYCSLSRCYRAEAKSSGEMSGLYRVHYFDKVEMFGLTQGSTDYSNKMLEEFVNIEKSLFQELGLHYRVVDMPPNELGPPAYRKFDIEAYMPGRDFWGEISSASNCTDYQSKRLNITYNKFHFDDKINPENITDVKKMFVHTINGTACAIPRIIISLVEQNQSADKNYISLPKVLHSYMNCDRIQINEICN